MTILRTDGLELKRTAPESDFELEVIDTKEGRTFYVKDRETLTDLLESEVYSDPDSGIAVQNW